VQKYKFNEIKTRFNFYSIVSQKNDNEDILLNKHFDTQDDRFKIITEALTQGFALNEESMVALHPSLKQARTQLTKDVKYLKVMKPNLSEHAANENDSAREDVESIEDDTQTQFSKEE
ncbi:unnamed protein product, partial [Rotaria sp. Silwood2]